MVTRAIALIASVCVACQGSSSSSRAPEPGSAGSAGSGSAIAASEPPVPDPGVRDAGEPDAPKSDEPEPPPDPSRVIAELGAIPAWQAVVDRAQLLGRRGQHGVVYGRIGPRVMVPPPPAPPLAPLPPGAGSGAGAGSGSGSSVGSGAGSGANVGSAAGSGTNAGSAAGSGSAAKPAIAPAPKPAVAPAVPALVESPYVWLIDDTEGNGSLAIRILLGDKAKLGDRIAAGGAWQLDEEKRWYWKPDAIQPLPPPPASDLKEAQPAVPSHAIANGELPSGIRTISLARDGDLVYFQLVGPVPTTDGDGWQVADELGNPTAVVMNLPGERYSYGGLDMRAADERWALKRGQTYWVRIGKLRKRGADKPPLVNARTAPIRVL